MESGKGQRILCDTVKPQSSSRKQVCGSEDLCVGLAL